MANRVIEKYDINSEKLRWILNNKEMSIRKLGPLAGVCEKQIRIYLKKGKMPAYMIKSIAKVLMISPSSFADLGVVDGEVLTRAVCLLALNEFSDLQVCKLLHIDKFQLDGILYSCGLAPFTKGVRRYDFSALSDDRKPAVDLVP